MLSSGHGIDRGRKKEDRAKEQDPAEQIAEKSDKTFGLTGRKQDEERHDCNCQYVQEGARQEKAVQVWLLGLKVSSAAWD